LRSPSPAGTVTPANVPSPTSVKPWVADRIIEAPRVEAVRVVPSPIIPIKVVIEAWVAETLVIVVVYNYIAARTELLSVGIVVGRIVIIKTLLVLVFARIYII
tara:strand:- start:484 stop:792 length:309 start_codon:yes stop_codon:yes gene_type:complete